MALSLSSIPGTKFDPTDFQLVKLYESAAKGQNYDFLRLLDVSADHPAKLFARYVHAIESKKIHLAYGPNLFDKEKDRLVGSRDDLVWAEEADSETFIFEGGKTEAAGLAKKLSLMEKGIKTPWVLRQITSLGADFTSAQSALYAVSFETEEYLNGLALLSEAVSAIEKAISPVKIKSSHLVAAANASGEAASDMKTAKKAAMRPTTPGVRVSRKKVTPTKINNMGRVGTKGKTVGKGKAVENSTAVESGPVFEGGKTSQRAARYHARMLKFTHVAGSSQTSTEAKSDIHEKNLESMEGYFGDRGTKGKTVGKGKSVENSKDVESGPVFEWGKTGKRAARYHARILKFAHVAGSSQTSTEANLESMEGYFGDRGSVNDMQLVPHTGGEPSRYGGPMAGIRVSESDGEIFEEGEPKLLGSGPFDEGNERGPFEGLALLSEAVSAIETPIPPVKIKSSHFGAAANARGEAASAMKINNMGRVGMKRKTVGKGKAVQSGLVIEWGKTGKRTARYDAEIRETNLESMEVDFGERGPVNDMQLGLYCESFEEGGPSASDDEGTHSDEEEVQPNVCLRFFSSVLYVMSRVARFLI